VLIKLNADWRSFF